MNKKGGAGAWRGYRYYGSWYTFFGRILIASLFLIVGWSKIADFSAAEQMIAAGGFPWPALFTVLAIIFEFCGVLMLLFGFHARLAAWMLIVFSLIATFTYHNPTVSQADLLMFLKDLAIIGGLLYVVANGAGRGSISHWNERVCKMGKACPDCGADDDGGAGNRSTTEAKMEDEDTEVTIVDELEEGGYLPSMITVPTR